jgi:alanyl-tRNA synthetase
MISDGVFPKNVDQGYILRRLIRRAIREFYKMGYEQPALVTIAEVYIKEFTSVYGSIEKNQDSIRAELKKEEEKFGKTLSQGVREFDKITRTLEKGNEISGAQAFTLFDTYGFPVEMTIEIAKEKGFTVDSEGFKEKFKAHQELSRTASAGMFKGGLADQSEKTTALHSACHLMLAGLRKVLGSHVAQAGSNITEERLRFDFTHGEKMTPEQIQAVEAFVNEAIGSELIVQMQEEDKEAAKNRGVCGSFWEKYPDTVKVYKMVGSSNGIVYSEELCGGPHVENSKEMGVFKIQKEESSSSGVRRIKAVLL